MEISFTSVRKAFLFFLVLNLTKIYAQEIKKIKQENDSFRDAFYESSGGDSEYEYYLNASQKKILNGSYKYFKRGQDVAIEINGRYSEDKKTGKWIYKYIIYKLDINAAKGTTLLGKTYVKVGASSTDKPETIVTHEVNYTNDLLEGQFLYKYTSRNNDKWETKAELSLTLNSKLNVFVGSVKYFNLDNPENLNRNVSGTYDEIGAPHGVWIYNNCKVEKAIFNNKEEQNKLVKIEANYDHGILVSEKVTDMLTNEAFVDYKRQEKTWKDSTIKSQNVYFKSPEGWNKTFQVVQPNNPVFAFYKRFENMNGFNQNYIDNTNYTSFNKTIGFSDMIPSILPSLPAYAPNLGPLKNYSNVFGRKVYYKNTNKQSHENYIKFKSEFPKKCPWAAQKSDKSSIEGWYGLGSMFMFWLNEYEKLFSTNQLLNAKIIGADYTDKSRNLSPSDITTKEYPFMYEDGTIPETFDAKLQNLNWNKYNFASAYPKDVENFFGFANQIDFFNAYLSERYLTPSMQIINFSKKKYFRPYTSAAAVTKDCGGYGVIEELVQTKNNIVGITNYRIVSACNALKVNPDSNIINLSDASVIEKNMFSELGLSKLRITDTTLFLQIVSAKSLEINKFYNTVETAFDLRFCNMSSMLRDFANDQWKQKNLGHKFFLNAIALVDYNSLNNCKNVAELYTSLESKTKLVNSIVELLEREKTNYLNLLPPSFSDPNSPVINKENFKIILEKLISKK